MPCGEAGPSSKVGRAPVPGVRSRIARSQLCDQRSLLTLSELQFHHWKVPASLGCCEDPLRPRMVADLHTLAEVAVVSGMMAHREMERWPWIILVGPLQQQGLYRREAGGQSQRRGCDDGSRGWSDVGPRAQGCGRC